MNSRLSAGLMVTVLTGCAGADGTERNFASVQQVCPEAVTFFPSATRIPGMYREVALLPLQSFADRETAKRAAAVYRQQAGELGANGVVLSSRIIPEASPRLIGEAIGDSIKRRRMAVAIYIPSDSEWVDQVCRPSPALAPVASASALKRVTESDNVILASRRLPLSPAGSHHPLVRVRRARLPAPQIGPVAAPDPTEQPDSAAFSRNQDVRSALASLERLDFVTGAEEVRPGLVRLSMGNVEPRARMEYHMSLLHGSYQAALPYGWEAIVELWSKGSKVGEYTKEGLVVDAETR